MIKTRKIICLVCFVAVIVIIIASGIGIIVYQWNLYWIWHHTQLSIAQKKCEEYTKHPCNNSITFPNEIFPSELGNEVLEAMFPHMAYLKISTGAVPDLACGGSLISEYFIMTSAHCVFHLKPQQILVKLGSIKVNDSAGIWLKVAQIHTYEKYRNISNLHDVAVLRLNTSVEFDKKIRPICLSVKDLEDNSNTRMLATGWDLDEKADHAPGRLQMLDTRLDETSTAHCRNLWRQYYDKMMFCATHQTERRTKCQIDPGGPLQVVLKKECASGYEQLGIASCNYFSNCTMNSTDTLVVLYTKVQFYVPWIVTVVWPEENSMKKPTTWIDPF